jgi:protein O-GlcNAc transferase
LGSALKSLGLLDEAIEEFREAIRIKPEYKDAHNNLVFAVQFHPDYEAGAVREEIARCNARHAQPPGNLIRPHGNDRNPDRRLRIGYVSADFRNHSVSQFLLPLFEKHDHSQCEVFCFSDVLKQDGMTVRLRARVDHWQSICGWTDDRVADRIRDQKIDILVDLSGRTAGNRLGVFGRKPAPVQVSYLGYPGTTGLKTIDYRMTDAIADPADEVPGDRVFRLPVCNWCFGAPENAPEVGPLPAESAGSITFGTFNNFAKVLPGVMDLWARILNAVPSSRLIIKSRGVNERSVRERVHRFFTARGVDENRVELRGRDVSAAAHLAGYNEIDIALDTFPYHGTTTTCEALWMGVPVVTLAGNAHFSRVGVSLLTNLGHPEWVADSADRYFEIAAGLAKDLPRLTELRKSLRERMAASSLMDAARFARDMEAAYREMWREWCAGAK